MKSNACLYVALLSEKNRTKALRRELKLALDRVFELEFPQMGIRAPANPNLKIVERAKL